MSSRWTVLLTHQAEQDFAEILRWTTRRFGPEQARTYAGTLSQAIEAFSSGPEVVGCRARDDILPGIRTLHVARQGYTGRHFVVFRTGTGLTIEILRILHDSMDLARHLPFGDLRQ